MIGLVGKTYKAHLVMIVFLSLFDNVSVIDVPIHLSTALKFTWLYFFKVIFFIIQLQQVFVNCIGDLFENQVVLFEGILKSGRYISQV